MISEQHAVKQHIDDIKTLVSNQHQKVRLIYLEEGAKKACIAEFDEMVKGLTKDMSKGFLARVSIVL